MNKEFMELLKEGKDVENNIMAWFAHGDPMEKKHIMQLSKRLSYILAEHGKRLR